jgi:hypothetical protein
MTPRFQLIDGTLPGFVTFSPFPSVNRYLLDPRMKRHEMSSLTSERPAMGVSFQKRGIECVVSA